MVKLVKNSGTVSYNVNEYVCDLIDDVQYLPLNCGMGSVALCIEDGSVWIRNSDAWVILTSSGGDAGGGGSVVLNTLPTIGENGNWYIDGVDTGVSATVDNSIIYTSNNISELAITPEELQEILK